eukprot:5744439-Amphidinium_carterae.1
MPPGCTRDVHVSLIQFDEAKKAFLFDGRNCASKYLMASPALLVKVRSPSWGSCVVRCSDVLHKVSAEDCWKSSETV